MAPHSHCDQLLPLILVRAKQRGSSEQRKSPARRISSPSGTEILLQYFPSESGEGLLLTLSGRGEGLAMQPVCCPTQCLLCGAAHGIPPLRLSTGDAALQGLPFPLQPQTSGAVLKPGEGCCSPADPQGPAIPQNRFPLLFCEEPQQAALSSQTESPISCCCQVCLLLCTAQSPPALCTAP